jgi:hypothetical protein
MSRASAHSRQHIASRWFHYADNHRPQHPRQGGAIVEGAGEASQPLHGAGSARLARPLASVERLRQGGILTAWVFRRADGTPIKSIRGAWEMARTAAGYPRALLHDVRRTAAQPHTRRCRAIDGHGNARELRPKT